MTAGTWILRLVLGGTWSELALAEKVQRYRTKHFDLDTGVCFSTKNGKAKSTVRKSST